MLPHVTQRLLQTGSTGALEDAAAFVLARLRTDGASHGEDDDFSGHVRQGGALLEWDRVHDRILPLKLFYFDPILRKQTEISSFKL